MLNRTLLAGCVVLAATLAHGTAIAATRHVNPDGVCGGNIPCYTTIQDAINAANNGDVIMVQAAIYNIAAKIDVNKEVQILGPQAYVNPLPSQGTVRVPGSPSEAIIDGGGTLSGLMVINASNVEINGLEFRNGTGDLVDSEAGLAQANVAIRNCIIHDSSGDEGVQLRNVLGAIVECNHVYETAGDGINICCSSVNGVIRYNEVHDIHSQDAAIYVYDHQNPLILANLTYNTTSNDGIKVGAKNGSDAAGVGGTVRANLVHSTAQDGIAIYMSNTVVSCNEVYGSSSENGGIYLAQPIGSVSVFDNYVHDNTFDTAKWGDPAGIMVGTAPDATTISITNNRVVNNSPNGVTNKAAALLVAAGNWWGAASGPGPVGPGTGDQVSTNVDFTPWLTSAPSPSCPTPGQCDGGPTPNRTESWGRLKVMYR